MKNRVYELMIAILIMVLAVGVVLPTTTSATTSAPVAVSYVIASDWGSGCMYNINIRNITSTTIPGGWRLSWRFIGDQKMIYPTPPIVIQVVSDVTYTAPSYLTIPAGGTVTIGINVSGTGRGMTSFKFNGIPL